MSSVKPKKRKRLSALLGGAVTLTFALTACSAGMVTQTDTKVPAIPGTDAQIVNDAEDVRIQLRDMLITYNGIDGYEVGADAPLAIRIFNSGGNADALIDVTADGYAEAVTVVDETVTTPTEEPEEPEAPGPDDEGAEQPDDEGGEQPGDEGAEGEEAPGDETPTTEPTEEPAPEPIALELPVDGYQLLTPDEGVFLQLTGLEQPLNTGSVIQVTFTFEVAGSITVEIPMALPTSTDLPDRETAHFDDEGH